MNNYGQCALCGYKEKICRGAEGKMPDYCSTLLYPEAVEISYEESLKDDNIKFILEASRQEASCYIEKEAEPHYLHPVKPRLQELIEFSKRMGYKKLGLAFCAGLHREAAVFVKILETHGFEVVSVVCKVGGIRKDNIGLTNEEKVRMNTNETMCNPIGQAEVLNSCGTDFNILLGLCVGHDSMFIKYSKSMVTVFAVKDRVLAHNPLGAIYTSNSYYERYLNGPIQK